MNFIRPESAETVSKISLRIATEGTTETLIGGIYALNGQSFELLASATFDATSTLGQKVSLDSSITLIPNALYGIAIITDDATILRFNGNYNYKTSVGVGFSRTGAGNGSQATPLNAFAQTPGWTVLPSSIAASGGSVGFYKQPFLGVVK